MTRDVEPGTCTRAHIDTPESIDPEHPAARVRGGSAEQERERERERERNGNESSGLNLQRLILAK
jgi:hypothetical protein